MWYKGYCGDEYGLRYGDEVRIKPLEKNFVEGECFGYRLTNLRTGKTQEVMDNLEKILDCYTAYETDLFETDIPKKPFMEYNCPNCGESVRTNAVKCDNCGQVLIWE